MDVVPAILVPVVPPTSDDAVFEASSEEHPVSRLRIMTGKDERDWDAGNILKDLLIISSSARCRQPY
jgi:hypothetical protein